MFERLGKAMVGLRASSDPSTLLAQWAASQGLAFKSLIGGAYAIAGRWQDRAVRVECGAPSRDYLQGMELMGRADLGLATASSVVLMNRPLKRALEQRATALYASYTDELQTSAAMLPEEIRWLATYRDAGWAGPDEAFWERYAVLTDSTETAKAWLDTGAVQRLMTWPVNGVSATTPVLFMLMRGKTYLRLQIDQTRDTATAVHALDLFRHLSEQARAVPAS
ncbi:MAG: hypothetical protein AB7S86_11735 [Hydrogenophaga sp.]|uniref:hypothetical protein n=1 Tax=Hydrogenophaga sp. TaxID=1904254 RepID=UPI003D0BB6AD